MDNNVVKLATVNMKDRTKFKAEGAAFEAIRLAVRRNKQARKAANLMREEAHKALWDTIHANVPELERGEDNYTLDTSHEELDLYIIEKRRSIYNSMFGNMFGGSDD